MKLLTADWAEARDHVLPLRLAVFVHEQGVPLEMEEDDDDPLSDHAWMADEEGKTIATGRLLPDGHVGRLAVDKAQRGVGFGGLILAHLIEMARAKGLPKVILHAQTTASGFYETFGFVAVGDVFMEAGLEHQLMTLRLS